MKTLLMMGLREVWRTKGRVLLVAIILALQVATLGGTFTAVESLIHTRDSYYDELAFADLEVGFVGAAESEMPALESLRKIPGVKAVSRRNLAKGYIEDATGQPYPVLVVYLDGGLNPPVNGIKVLEGAFIAPGNKQEAVVDRGFAAYRGVKIGDKLVVDPDRFASRFTVVGVGLSPEFLAPTANPDVIFPAKGSLGIIYASREQLDDRFIDRLYNNLVFTYEPGQDDDAVKARILTALAQLDIERVVPRRSNFGYRVVEETLRGPKVLTPPIALVIAIVAGIVAYVTVNRMVVSQRREIGALLAMGYPPRYFVIGYLLLGLVPGLLGGGLGMLWSMGLARTSAQNITDISGLPPLRMTYSPGMLLVAGSTALFIAVVCTLVPLMSILRMHPATAIRGGNEISFRGLPGPIEALIGRGRAPTRYALRNMFRRKRLSFAIILLICGAVSLPVSLLTMNSSCVAWAEKTTDELAWDGMLGFKVGLKPDALREVLIMPGLKETEPFVSGGATFLRPGSPPHEVTVRGLTTPLRLGRLNLSAGTTFSSPDAMEAIINENLSRGGARSRLGEKVTIRAKGKSYEVTVVGLVNDSSMTTVSMPLRAAQTILDLEGKVSGVYALYGQNPREGEPPPLPPMDRKLAAETESMDDVPVPEPVRAKPAPVDVKDPAAMRKHLLQNEMVTTVQSKKDVHGSTAANMREYRASTMPFIFISASMAFLALLSVLALIFLERETEYATLRAMGYGRSELARIVFTEVGVLSTIGFLASLAGWFELSRLFLSLMADAWFEIETAYWGIDLVLVAVPTMVVLLAAVALGVRSLMRIGLRAALSARAIG